MHGGGSMAAVVESDGVSGARMAWPGRGLLPATWFRLAKRSTAAAL